LYWTAEKGGENRLSSGEQSTMQKMDFDCEQISPTIEKTSFKP